MPRPAPSLSRCLSRTPHWVLALLATLLATEAQAQQQIVAIGSGDWSASASWKNGQVPSAAHTAYIGSDFPGGGAASATITLSQNTSVSGVYLGYSTSSPTSGTLD